MSGTRAHVSSRGAQQRRRCGTVLILAAIMMTLLMVCVGFAVDIGYLNVVRTQLQASADAAALAGADVLYDGPTYALYEARRFGELNAVANVLAQIDPQKDIEFGIWDRRTRTFSLQLVPDDNTDAVRVTVRRSASRRNAVNLFFARVIGFNSGEVSAYAVAEAQSGLCGGIVGLESVRVHGNAYTDSYWSEDGPYATQMAGSNGHVCSNGNIRLNGSVTVNGNANTLQTETVDLLGGAAVTGSTQPRSDEVYAPPVITGDAATVNDNAILQSVSTVTNLIDNQGDFRLTGGNLLVPPGTYWFNDFSLSGNASLTFTGPTVIYVADTMSVGGNGLINQTKVPSNVQIYALGDTATFAGTSDFYGVIYGPSTDIKITGSNQYYGAVVGRTVDISTSGNNFAAVHYDESLGQLLRVRPRAYLVE